MTPTPHGQVPEALIYAGLPDLDDTLWLAIGQHRRAITIVETSAAAKAVDAAVHSLLRAYADATHALRASHGQAPANQKLTEQICISDTNQSAACAVGNVGTTSDAQTTRSTHDAPATQQAGEVVAQLAAERDELFQAAIDFIRTLTGMEPPPIEVAPPEVFAPFHAFVNTVQAIINKRNSSPREGMVMVPKEPTHHMLNAAASAYKDARQSLGAYNAPWAAYRAMLEVAAPPTTPAGSGKGE